MEVKTKLQLPVESRIHLNPTCPQISRIEDGTIANPIINAVCLNR